MDVKSFLTEIRKCEAMIQNRCDTIKQLHDEAQRITPKPIDGMKVMSSPAPDNRETLICTYIQMECELEAEVRYYHKLRRDAIKLMEQLPLSQYKVIYQVYILGRSLKEVAAHEDMSYTWATTTQNHAFRSLQKLLDARDHAGQG